MFSPLCMWSYARLWIGRVSRLQQQYINVMKVLISALRKNAVEEEDEFDKFMEELNS